MRRSASLSVRQYDSLDLPSLDARSHELGHVFGWRKRKLGYVLAELVPILSC